MNGMGSLRKRRHRGSDPLPCRRGRGYSLPPKAPLLRLSLEQRHSCSSPFERRETPPWPTQNGGRWFTGPFQVVLAWRTPSGLLHCGTPLSPFTSERFRSTRYDGGWFQASLTVVPTGARGNGRPRHPSQLRLSNNQPFYGDTALGVNSF